MASADWAWMQRQELPILSWQMTCDRGYGEQKETEWVQCAISGKHAEGALGQYLTIRGDLKANAYTDRNRQLAASIKVFVDKRNLLSGNDNQQNHPPATHTTEPNAQAKGEHQHTHETL